MIKREMAAVAGLLGVVLTVQGAVIVSYDFSSDISPNFSNTFVNAHDFTAGSGISGGRSGLGQNLYERTSATGADLSAAQADHDYYAFTVDVGSGSSMDLTSLDLNVGFTKDSSNDGVLTATLLSSIDGFTAPVEAIVSNTTNAPSGGALTTQAWSIDLTGSSFQELTGSVEFRFYLHDDITEENIIHRLDDVFLNGTVFPPPSPIIASYDFTSGLSANTNDANVAAKDFAEGTSFAASADAGRSSSGQNLFAKASLTSGGGSGSLDGAITAGDYFTFTIEVKPGFTMNLSSLELNAGYTSFGLPYTGKTVTAALLTSVDGFSSGDLVADISSDVIKGEEAPQYNALIVDLRGSSFQELTGEVEFQIYLYDDTGHEALIHRLDDVILKGYVSAPQGTIICIM